MTATKPLPLKPFICMVRGSKEMPINYRNVKIGEPVRLVAEPYNPYDRFAIKVTREDGYVLGYIPRRLAERMDASQWSRGRVAEVLYRRPGIKSAGLRIQCLPNRPA